MSCPDEEIDFGIAGSKPSVNQVHERLRQCALDLQAHLERKDADLLVEAKRSQVSAGIIEELRKELRNRGTARARPLATTSSQTINSVTFQEQRISDLETQLTRKDVDLQKELAAVAAYTKTVKDLRDSVQSLRDELKKSTRGTSQSFDTRPRQLRTSSADVGSFYNDSSDFVLFVNKLCSNKRYEHCTIFSTSASGYQAYADHSSEIAERLRRTGSPYPLKLHSILHRRFVLRSLIVLGQADHHRRPTGLLPKCSSFIEDRSAHSSTTVHSLRSASSATLDASRRSSRCSEPTSTDAQSPQGSAPARGAPFMRGGGVSRRRHSTPSS